MEFYRFAVNLNADTFLSPVLVSVKCTFDYAGPDQLKERTEKEYTSHTIVARKKLVPDREHDSFYLVGVKLKEFISHHDTLNDPWQLADCTNSNVDASPNITTNGATCESGVDVAGKVFHVHKLRQVELARRDRDRHEWVLIMWSHVMGTRQSASSHGKRQLSLPRRGP